MQKYLFDKNRINSEQKILNHLLIQQRHLKKTLYSYLEKISKDILDIPKDENPETLISCINEIQSIYENTKLNITTILDLKNLLENVSKSKHLNTFDFEKYTSLFFELFDNISKNNIDYYSFMEKLQKYMHLYFSGNQTNIFFNLSENKTIIDFSDDIIDENIIDDNITPSSDTTSIDDIISEVLFEDDSKNIIDELLKDAVFESLPEELETTEDNNTTNLYYEIIEDDDNNNNNNTLESSFDSAEDSENNNNSELSSDFVENLENNSNSKLPSDSVENINDNTEIVSNTIEEKNNFIQQSNNSLINETFSLNLLKELIENVVEKTVEKVISDESFEKVSHHSSDLLEIKNIEEDMEHIENVEAVSSDELLSEEVKNDNSNEEIENLENVEADSSDELLSEEIENDNSNSVTHLIEKTLFIFNDIEKAILPYSISELETCFSSNPENYSSIQDIIDKEYTVSLENYRNSSLARYQEAFKLAKEKSELTLTDSINFARKFVFEEQVTPLIIASCTTIEDLNNYLDCLNNNILNEFNCFKIIEK